MIKIRAWPDADHNGDMMDTLSTSGHFIEIIGAEDRGMPLSWAARKQGGTAQRTAEAETVSMAACLRNEAIPLQSLMQAILRRPIDLEIMEDNAATITSVNKGYSPSLRHLPRTQRVSLGLLHESITSKPENGEGNTRLLKVETGSHKGDLFTKELAPKDFNKALDMIRIIDDGSEITKDQGSV